MSLVITGIIDGPLTGGLPKAIELKVLADIPDLSVWGLGLASNGGASSGVDFALSGAATAGQSIYVASEAAGFSSFFGFAPTFTSTVANVNGDDAIELFENGVLVDAFGQVGVDGSAEAWDYMDGWAYRNSDTPANPVFAPSEWTFSGVDALDGATSNATAATPFPTGSYVPPETGGEADFTLELLHFSDQEGNSSAVIDAPNLSAVLNALRAQDLGDDGLPDNTLTLSSGDTFIPSPFFSASQAVFGSVGIADILIQNELGLQASALGNHEFDAGPAVLAGLISGSAAGTGLNGADFTGAAYPYLSTNIDFQTQANLAPLEVAGGGAPQANTVTSSVVIDVNGENIGVVGATTPTLLSISSPGSVGVTPAPFDGNPTPEQLDALAAVIQAEVDALLAATPDLNKVILLTHMQQINIELELAARLENVDIIAAGGSNTRLFDDNDTPRPGDSDQGQYPTFVTNAGGTQTAVVNTDGSYKYVGRLAIDFDADGNIIADSYDPEVSGAYATDAAGVAALGAEGLVDPEIQQIADLIEAQIVATEGNVFGISDVFLNGNRSGVDDATNPDGVRSQETNLGNLTADANLAAAQAIDDTVVVSIKNGGGIRASIGQTVVPAGGTGFVRLPNGEIVDGAGNVVKPEGGISQNDIATALAFNNGLTLLTLTKAELVAVLEHAVSGLPAAVGGFPQVSGLEFSFDDDLPAGNRIVNAAIVDAAGTVIAELVRDGEIAGDAAQSFRVVTLNFLAGGGDGYPLTALANPNRVDLYDLDGNAVADGIRTGDATFADNGTEQDAFAEYLQDNFLTTPYDQADGGRGGDTRIQNLDWRADTVFDDVVEPSLVINEIVVSTTGTDTEFVELLGDANLSLDGVSLIEVSSTGVIDSVISFTGGETGDNGYFLAASPTAEANLGVAADLDIADNTFNNAPRSYLLVRDLTGTSGTDIDTDDDGVIDNAAWGEIIDSVAIVDATSPAVYSPNVVGPDGTFLGAGAVRNPELTGDFDLLPFSDLGAYTPTSGGGGGGTGPTEVTIMEIQGAGHVSGLVSATPQDPTTGAGTGARVLTTGIVTAVAANGFYMQDATGDGNAATSDAIFVFTGGAPLVALGDGVSVEGTVSEFYPGGQSSGNLPTTQLSGAPVISVTSTGNALPAAVVIGAGGLTPPTESINDDAYAAFDPSADGVDFFEAIEGMRVTLSEPVAIAGTNGFGEVFVTVGGASGLSDRGTLNISPDDFNPERIQIDADATVSGFEMPAVNVGASFGDVTGVISYSFGNYELVPTETVTVVEPGLLAPEVTALSGGDNQLLVASYNVLNLDPNEGDGDTDIADGRFDAIAEDILQNLNAPDIIGLQEIQDNSGSADDGTVSASVTLQTLIDAIDLANDGVANGNSGYAYIDNTFITDGANGGQPGGNIRTAFLYRTDRVELVEGSVTAIGSQTAGEAFAGGRLPLAATFTFNGEEVTVLSNHLSSKGGSAPIMGVRQPFEELQEDTTVNGSLDERQAQAAEVKAFIDDLLAANADANIVVTGDFNEFEFVSPLETLESSLTNLTETLPEDERYSFIFQGNSQSLDHILVSGNLAAGSQFDAVHINAEFAETDARSSDHDPLLAQITIGETAPDTVVAGVDFDLVRFVRTSASEIVDGEVGRTRELPLSSDSLGFVVAGVDLIAEAPGWENLSLRAGTVGIRSRGEAANAPDARLVDGEEVLDFRLGGNFGDGVAATFDFGAVTGEGQVQASFYLDGELIGALEADISGGAVTFDLEGAAFDRVRLAAGDGTAFDLDAFAFTRLVEDPVLS